MKDYKKYFSKKMPDINFGVDIFIKSDLTKGKKLEMHWHEHMQIYYFISGTAMLECSMKQFMVCAGDIVVINSNELHFMESLSDDLRFYVIRFDLPFLFSSQVDLCQTKFIVPLSQNRITFCNLIRDDKEVKCYVVKTIEEYSNKEIGFELAVKSAIYQLIVLLLRGHINKIMSDDELSSKKYALRRFESVLNFIANHYTEKITVKDLAQQANITVFYFCRIFKQLTGKTMTDYINEMRLEKSVEYLQNPELNITEVALKCGFEGINYYSRLFKRHYKISPLKYRNNYIINNRVK